MRCSRLVDWRLVALLGLACSQGATVGGQEMPLPGDKPIIRSAPPVEVLAPLEGPAIEGRSREAAQRQRRLRDSPQLEQVEFREVSLAEAIRSFNEATGMNVIASAEAGQVPVSAYLRNVTAMAALDAITRANGLFYRVDEESGIIRVSTTDEYERDLASFREEQTHVFTLLYPNPIAVAQSIQHVFGARVQLNVADSDMMDMMDLSQRLTRFDLIDGRSLGLGTFEGGAGFGGRGGLGMGGLGMGMGGLGMRGMRGLGMGGLGMGGLGMGGMGMPGMGMMGMPGMGMGMGGFAPGGLTGRSRQQMGMMDPRLQEFQPMEGMTAEQIQELENLLMLQQGQLDAEARAALLERRQATIHLSVIRRNNQLVVRTGDERTMQQITELIAQLDVPTPLVLLEVKVLRVELGDGFNSAFEYFGGDERAAGAFSDGNLLPPFPGGNPASRTLAEGLGVAGTVPGALAFQIVDENFRFRMQLLESKNRVTALSTPMILTANNEVSRIFVGDTLPFTVGFTPPIAGGGINAPVAAGTPITELRDVGQSLLITPNINADRTVTLRIVEENSDRVIDGATIPVPGFEGVAQLVNVDTVRRRTVSGTIVAQDGMAVVLGGLIEEQVRDTRDQVPVLGQIPGLGFFFRRQNTGRTRSELVVVVRPYVFNTPAESAMTSEKLMSELSLHPKALDPSGTMQTFLPCEVVRPDPECHNRASMFRFHSVAPKIY